MSFLIFQLSFNSVKSNEINWPSSDEMVNDNESVVRPSNVTSTPALLAKAKLMLHFLVLQQ